MATLIDVSKLLDSTGVLCLSFFLNTVANGGV